MLHDQIEEGEEKGGVAGSEERGREREDSALVMPVSLAYTEKPEAEAETTTFCGLYMDTAFAYYTFDSFTAPISHIAQFMALQRMR